MGLTISPLEESEIPNFVRIELEAFRSHPRIPMLWRRGYTADLYEFYESEKKESLHNAKCRLIKAVDEGSGEMVAVSEWTFVLDPSPASQGDQESSERESLPPSNWPIDGNWELRSFFSSNSNKWAKQYLEGRSYIKLDILVTDPNYHHRGAGSRLLSWGIDEADSHGVLLCLEATPAGLSLYKRFGFEEVDAIRADMKQFGWDKPYDPEALKRVWMIRKPRPAT